MALKNLFLVIVLLGVSVSAVQSQNLLVVSGTVLCCQNCTGTTPTFPYAAVQLQCNSITVTTVTADANGFFTISLVNGLSVNGVTITVTSLQSCTLNVYTPLSQCNATLTLNAYLQSRIIPVNLLGGLLEPERFFCYGYN